MIGHSGATGANSNGDGLDVPENSWATGANPKVNSIYRRLLADHPALKGHNWNEAVDGSSVTDLMHQARAVLTHEPVPDIVFIVSIDNDVRCDGTDEENYDTYEAKMAEVVDYLQGSAPGMKIFFTDPPLSVHDYDAVVLKKDGGEAHISDPGPLQPDQGRGRRPGRRGLPAAGLRRVLRAAHAHLRAARGLRDRPGGAPVGGVQSDPEGHQRRPQPLHGQRPGQGGGDRLGRAAARLEVTHRLHDLEGEQRD